MASSGYSRLSGDLDQSPLAAMQTPLNLDGLSYEEYFKKVDEMIESVRQHWHSEQRVKSLKVVIQLTKLLADTSQIKLYAKKYKMIVDLLDEFGKLVHQRIHSLASVNLEDPQFDASPVQDSVALVELASERARDTCRNWFLKVASIRELVPRFYTEISIIKCCDILLKRSVGTGQEQLYVQSLMRLTKAAWGFGDPIVALHARAYLCKVASQLISWPTIDGRPEQASRSVLFEIVRANLRAGFVVVGQLKSTLVMRALRVQQVNLWTFFELLSGALQSISFTITHKDDLYTNEDELSPPAIGLFETMLTDCMEALRSHNDCSILATNIVLHSIIRSMPASIIVRHHSQLMELIRGPYESWAEFKGVAEDEGLRRSLASFYPTLESLALALDASVEFERNAEIYSPTLKREVWLFSRKIMDQLVMNDLAASDSSVDETDTDGLCGSIRPQYLKCFKAWLTYCNHYLDASEVDEFLQQFIERLRCRPTGAGAATRQSSHRQLDRNHAITSIIVELIKALTSGKRTVEEFRLVFGMKSFQSLFELLKRDDLRLEASRLIFETMRIALKLGSTTTTITNKLQSPIQRLAPDEGGGVGSDRQQMASSGPTALLISDKKMIDFMVTKLFTSINDSLGLLANDDDIDQLSQLLLTFIQSIHLPDHADRLNFLGKCRSALNNLNPCLEHIAREPLELALDYRRSERRRQWRRNYLNGCLAFTFVTIPALQNPLTRLELLHRGADLALDHMSLSLADYYLRQILLNLTDLVAALTPAETVAQSGPTNDSLQADHRSSNPPLIADTSAHQSRAAHHHQHQQQQSNRVIRQLVQEVKLILDVMLRHQDYIDLRYKLALADLIGESLLNDYSELLEQSKFLKLVNDNCSQVPVSIGNNANDGPTTPIDSTVDDNIYSNVGENNYNHNDHNSGNDQVSHNT